MWICRYFLYFIFCSCMGWFYECIYGICVTGKWENRGFLYGPVCPIYGVGAVSVMGIMEWGQLCGYKVDQAPYWLIFLVAFIGSIILEYGTHLFLERRFHACWWDYSNMPLNINGRICLPASIAFGFAGIFVVKVLAPYLNRIASGVSPIAIEALGMLTLAIGTADATLTVTALTDFEERVAKAEDLLNGRMENLVFSMVEKRDDAAEWILEGKDRLYQFSTDTVVDYMSDRYKSALSRIHTFKEIPGRVTHTVSDKVSDKTAQTTEMMNRTLKSIKKRVHMPMKRDQVPSGVKAKNKA